MIIKKSDAIVFKKLGVLMRVYKTKKASFVFQETTKGHAEEFYNTKSTFFYYIIAGKGFWFINGKKQVVNAGDLIIIKPKTKFYYKGKLKQLLVTIPTWNKKYEYKVRDIKL